LHRLRELLAWVFAGEPRVWCVAALCTVPLIALVCVYCALPRAYNTGTDSVEVHGYVAPVGAGEPMCVRGLRIPPGTARVRLKLRSAAPARPALVLALHTPTATVYSALGPLPAIRGRETAAVFALPGLVIGASSTPATACLTAAGAVSWAGTALPSPPGVLAPTRSGVPLSARIAVWYEPPRGTRQSYFAAAGTILRRAALFRPGWVGPATYAVLLLGLLPALAFAAVRCLALAGAGRPPRRLALWLYLLAFLNFACWALITPPFQAPDEADHFAYTQALVERGHAPSRNPASPLRRWSSAETLALEGVDYFTDHRAADSRPPWLTEQQDEYRSRFAAVRPRADDGGGNETAATHGPLYYAALAPAYAAGGSSPFTQLTLMRLASALIGALTVAFTFMLGRELAPGRMWLAVAAALLVTYAPMYGFISGIVNNDVGVNAGAAALVLLMIRMLRRGITIPTGALTGTLLVGLPLVKGTGLSLYPVAGLVLLALAWRHHARADAPGWVALLAGAGVAGALTASVLGGVHPASVPAGPTAISSNASAVGGALHDIPGYLSYLWQVFLPRLGFMARHFPVSDYPAYTIFVVRGWGAFGSEAIAFPTWVYVVITAAMVTAVPLGALAATREWAWVRGHLLELAVLLAIPTAVVMGFEAAYYTTGARSVIAEVGRYAFPAIAPLAILVVGALHAFGRRHMLGVAAGLLVAAIALSYAGQLLTLTAFYA
jgi:hypothetical protein